MKSDIHLELSQLGLSEFVSEEGLDLL
jgi:hypothetical protein